MMHGQTDIKITVMVITPSRMGWVRGVKKGKKEQGERKKIHIGS